MLLIVEPDGHESNKFTKVHVLYRTLISDKEHNNNTVELVEILFLNNVLPCDITLFMPDYYKTDCITTRAYCVII